MESTLTEPILQCPNCRSTLSVNEQVDNLDDRCPVCSNEISLMVFPRLYLEPADKPPARLAEDSEAKCNFYPELPAEKVCDECGCFLSEKAAVVWGDLDICLPCLHRLREKEKSANFMARAKLVDNRALGLVTLGAPVSLFTAPIAILLLLKHRNDGSGFIPRSRVRWWVAMLLSVACLLGWGILMVVWTSLILDDFS